MRIEPFRGYSPSRDAASSLVVVPYDVVDREEAAALAEGNPLSLLHVDRAEIDLPGETNPYADAVYAKAAENFKGLIAQGALVREPQACYYIYRLTMGDHVQTGIVATVRAEDYDIGLVAKHEKTRPDKENDRTRLIDAIGAQTGPILLSFSAPAAVREIVAAAVKRAADYDVTAPDGIRHEVWRLVETEPLREAFGSVPKVYIADGHHRAASGSRVAALRRTRAGAGEDSAHEGILAVLFPEDELKILAYNRVVHSLNGRSEEEFLAEVEGVFGLTPDADPVPTSPRGCSMYLGGRWYGLSWDVASDLDPVSRLDVSVLQDRLLAPVLGIADPRTSAEIEFVGGIRGTEELVRKVDAVPGAVAFSMYPTTVAQVVDIADAGQIMPPKSTWFEPKLRSGFFIHALD